MLKKITGLQRDMVVAIVIAALVFICFYEVIPLGFFSDDYYVMHRLTIDKQFWAPGFFRPLSDILLLFSYYTSDYNAAGYRLFNVIVHIINAFLLYKTLNKVYELNDKHRFNISLIAALLFASYPFHSESIIWIVGRASIVANTFGMLGLYFFFRQLNPRLKTILVCACYFIGLTSYESVMVIPGILFFAAWYRKSLKDAFVYMIPLGTTLIAHVIVRWFASGVFAGRYGGDIFQEGQRNYAVKFIKSFGRLFLPGMHSTQQLTILFIVIVVLIILSFFMVQRYQKRQFHFYILLWIMLLVSHILPAMMGVDSHTSDGDRLLYFPSNFLCAVLAFFIWCIIKTPVIKWAIVFLLITTNVFFLKAGNKNWIKADNAMNNIFATVKDNCCGPTAYFINLPDAIEGSFMFRNGFYEALAIHHIPSQKIHVVNYLLSQHAILQPDTIKASKTGDNTYRIPPFVTVGQQSFKVDSIAGNQTFSKEIKREPGALIFFWNRNKIVSLLP